MVTKVIMVTTVTGKLKGTHTKKYEDVDTAGASVVWYGGIFIGAVAILAGVVWILVLSGLIVWSSSFKWALIILASGVGLIVFSLWLKKVILASI